MSVKISQLPALTTPSRTDLIPLVDSSTNTTKYIQMMYALTGATRIIAPVGYQGYADYYTDGIKDDVEIQKAINDLSTIGGEVYIREGIYKFVTEVVCQNDQVKIRGAGMATILEWSNLANPSGIGLIRTNDYCIITDLQLNGNRSNNTGGMGIRVNNSARVWLDKLYFTDFQENCIDIVGTSGDTAHANNFTNLMIINSNSNGIQLHGFAYDNRFNNIWIGSCAAGVNCTDTNSFWSILHIWGCTGIGFYTTGQFTQVVDGYFETNGSYGLELNSAADCNFTNCNIWKNSSSGIFLNAACDRSNFTNIQVHDNTGPGLTQSGINVDIKLNHIHCYDSQSIKTQTMGMNIGSSASKWHISDCTTRAADHLTTNWVNNGTNMFLFNIEGVNPETYKDNGTKTTSVSIDRKLAKTHKTILGANSMNLSFFGGNKGDELIMYFVQDGAGNRQLVYPSNLKLAGTAFTLTTTASAIDMLHVVFDGSEWLEIGRASNLG